MLCSVVSLIAVLDEPPLGPWDLFVLCPSCRQAGEIREAHRSGQLKTYSYWCADCQRSWAVTATVEVTGGGEEQSCKPDARAHLPASPPSDAK
jgi:hypothetical protein